MASIRVLPDILARKIAAGEIVERPASVAKELVENALDANACRIVVEAEAGGKNRIVVRDDGIGMSPEDARLAFQRHATSKIRSVEDLAGIRTLGFRGEALPSIASVSRLRLRTSERESEQTLGTEVCLEGGELKDVAEIAWPAGTEIAVEDLFYNVPARRKFLRRDSTELGHLSRQVMQYALAYPEVEFRFRHQGRLVFDAPRVAHLKERIHQVLGDTFLEHLVAVDYDRDGIRVHGFASLPHEQRSSGASQYLYINRRMVRDRMLAHAARAAYQDLIPARSYPVFVLFLELDPELVDVNVHPTKTEVRFQNSRQVHRAVNLALQESLLAGSDDLFQKARTVPVDQPGSSGGNGKHAVADSIAHYFQRHSSSGTPFPQFTQAPDREETAPHGALAAGTGFHADEIPETAHLSGVPSILGQFVESFVVAADREGVLLIDQHVAHERVLFDRALKTLAGSSPVPTQRLLQPLTFDLNPQRQAVLTDIIEDLNSNGFEVEWFGPRTVAVKGVPALASECDARLLIEEILDSFDAPGSRSSGQRLMHLRERIAISLSCRSAIKINTPLSDQKMQWLMDELFHCENPFTCPHGRPIVLRISIEDVLKGFKRI